MRATLVNPESAKMARGRMSLSFDPNSQVLHFALAFFATFCLVPKTQLGETSAKHTLKISEAHHVLESSLARYC
jgi:hypothetical protein